jgi:hypothetical protein
MESQNVPDKLVRILDLWNNDAHFRAAMQTARARVAEEWGIVLDDQDRQILNRINLTLPLEELDRTLREEMA